MYEFLLSADLMVPDPDATITTFVKRIGLPEPKPQWRQDWPNHSYVAWFARVHKSLAVAPTRLEPQGHFDVPNPADPFFPPYLDHLVQLQGAPRPMKTHATVLVSRDLPALAERLLHRRLPFRIAPSSEEMPWDRLWVGVTPEDMRYRPVVDGGLYIEVIPLEPLQMPDATFSDPPPEPVDPAPGEMVRIVSRGFLVRDLDQTLSLLSQNMGFETAAPVEEIKEEGYRRARMAFSLRHGAALELIEPTRWESAPARYLATWGPGPYHIRISVAGLDAKAEDLRRRGTKFSVIPQSSAAGQRLRVDPDDLDGALVEFVEHTS